MFIAILRGDKEDLFSFALLLFYFYYSYIGGRLLGITTEQQADNVLSCL